MIERRGLVGWRRRSVTVATYNIHRCVGTDGLYHPDRTAEAINSLGADVIGLQEVSVAHFAAVGVLELNYLAELTGMRAIAGTNLVRGRRHFGNAILTNFPVLAERRLELSIGRYEPRTALDVDLDVEGHRLRVVVTHLGLRLLERQEQIGRLLECLGTLDAVTVMMGDFNEWHLTSPALRRIHRLFGRSKSLRTFPSKMPVLPLDRIWAHPAGRLLDLRVHISPTTRRASDHLPVSAILDWG